MKLTCEKCGAELKKTDTICPECGTVSEKATSRKRKSVKGIIFVIVALFIIVMAFGFFGGAGAPVRGYYDYDGRTYYYQKGVWYAYVDTYGWYAVVPDEGLASKYKEFYQGNTYKDGSSYEDFTKSSSYTADGSVPEFKDLNSPASESNK